MLRRAAALVSLLASVRLVTAVLLVLQPSLHRAATRTPRHPAPPTEHHGLLREVLRPGRRLVTLQALPVDRQAEVLRAIERAVELALVELELLDLGRNPTRCHGLLVPVTEDAARELVVAWVTSARLRVISQRGGRRNPADAPLFEVEAGTAT